MKPLLAGFALLLCPVILHAQATRTWVSGVGDDANPCSRTAPGKTLAGAISKTAPAGIIDSLDPGDFGALTITKSITIDGSGAPVGVSVSGTNAITINAATTDVVVLRNMTLDGLNAGGNGVSINTAAVVIIDHCRISGFGNGISLATSNAGVAVYIKDSIIDNCSAAAVTLGSTAAANVTMVNCHVSDSGTGVSAAPNVTLQATDTVSSGNGNAGFVTTATGATMTLTRCVASDNGVGIQSNSLITISNCDVFSNAGAGLQVVGKGAQIVACGSNAVAGNNPNGAPTSSILPQ